MDEEADGLATAEEDAGDNDGDGVYAIEGMILEREAVFTEVGDDGGSVGVDDVDGCGTCCCFCWCCCCCLG